MMIHIWWAGKLVSPFWLKVLDLYTVLFSVLIPNDPKITLLSIISGPFSKIRGGMLRHFLTGARIVIP